MYKHKHLERQIGDLVGAARRAPDKKYLAGIQVAIQALMNSIPVKREELVKTNNGLDWRFEYPPGYRESCSWVFQEEARDVSVSVLNSLLSVLYMGDTFQDHEMLLPVLRLAALVADPCCEMSSYTFTDSGWTITGIKVPAKYRYLFERRHYVEK